MKSVGTPSPNRKPRCIHRWHTCKGTARQNSTNPCSEYLFLDNTACNLASLNLLKFREADGRFNVERYRSAIRLFITSLFYEGEAESFAEILGVFSVFSVLFYSTFLTSVWTWGYIFSTWVLRLFTRARLAELLAVDLARDVYGLAR